MILRSGKGKSVFALALAYCAAVWAGEIAYSVQTVAGSNLVGDGGSALNAQLSDAQCLAVDRLGNVYIADPNNHRVRRVSAAGLIQTVAGTGYPGFSGDGGPAAQARLNAPYGLAVDASGKLYMADSGNQRVRTVFNGIMRTLPLPGVNLALPTGIAGDTAGGIYIADGGNHRIFRRTLTGAVFQVAAGIALDSAREALTDGL